MPTRPVFSLQDVIAARDELVEEVIEDLTKGLVEEVPERFGELGGGKGG